MGNCLSPIRSVENEVTDIVAASGTDNGSLIDGGKLDPGIAADSDVTIIAATTSATTTGQDEMVRRINEELAEFRQQLKKSQELFHAMQSNGSTSALSMGNVTQSCPILAESEANLTPKKPSPNLVTCSTQTDPSMSESGQSSRRNSAQQSAPKSLLDAIDDDGDGDGNYLDKLSDDISYRLTINLPTVLEESDQEVETSPGGSGHRRMSSILGENRRKAKLVRSPVAHEEDVLLPDSNSNSNSNSNHSREKIDDAASTETDFKSAVSSLPGSVNSSVYNSLERPLQITGSGGRGRNGDSDSMSFVSDGTFGSPLSYPSSPTYWTPLEGSSSQETITNIDGGDKTPVNDDNGHDHLEVLSCPGRSTRRTENENGSKKKRSNGRSASSCGPSLPSYNQTDACVIPDSRREHMIKYAYDPVRRISEAEAGLLSRQEWRTLKLDLDKKDKDDYRKGNEEDSNDVEGGLPVESGCLRGLACGPDLEEEAEECLEKFPGLVEKLFEDLDVIKRTQKNPAEFDLEIISTRFNHLAHTFKVEHSNLTQRKEINLSNHDHATTKVEDIIESLSEIVQKFDDITSKTKVPEDLSKLILTFKHIPGDLDIYTHELSKTSRRVGMMDVQVRLYKMIEVMVLYVHILRNICSEKDKDIQSASITYSISNSVTTRNNGNGNGNGNNNNGKICNGNHEGDFNPDFPDRPTQLLQHLLGPIKPNLNLDNKLVLKDDTSSPNLLIRFWSDAYETIRCEFFWPWNGEETWKGIKEGFSFILMVFGLFIIFRSLFPTVNADCCPVAVSDLGSMFSKHGKLHHPAVPPI
ncbi:uncharacterized protein LOC110855470 isoform X2 [Folsomia candida]|uniref:uncharacterized protein LOC110855470 isoform X2 n=1 Tax=Folsomia candida TaxID=158441 RepID=UPI00160501C1|nr:uncharacterized protein LOC110855470 isoform X2 [Folsomia candida]